MEFIIGYAAMYVLTYVITTSLHWSRFGAVLGFDRTETLFHAVMAIFGLFSIFIASILYSVDRGGDWIPFRLRLIVGRIPPAEPRYRPYCKWYSGPLD